MKCCKIEVAVEISEILSEIANRLQLPKGSRYRRPCFFAARTKRANVQIFEISLFLMLEINRFTKLKIK